LRLARFLREMTYLTIENPVSFLVGTNIALV